MLLVRTKISFGANCHIKQDFIIDVTFHVYDVEEPLSLDKNREERFHFRSGVIGTDLKFWYKIWMQVYTACITHDIVSYLWKLMVKKNRSSKKTFFFSISSFRLFPGDKAIYENLYFEKSIIDIKMDKNANFCFLQYLSTKQKKITTNKQVVTKLRWQN